MKRNVRLSPVESPAIIAQCVVRAGFKSDLAEELRRPLELESGLFLYFEIEQRISIQLVRGVSVSSLRPRESAV